MKPLYSKVCNRVSNLLVEPLTGTDRMYTHDTGAFHFDNISAEDVKLFLLKQMSKSLSFSFLRLDIFCLAGSAYRHYS